MGLFDSLMGEAEKLAGPEVHSLLDGALQGSSLSGVSGLLSQLQQGGLSSEIRSLCAGGAASIGPDQIRSALGDSHLASIAASMGINPEQALAAITQHLPALAAANAAR